MTKDEIVKSIASCISGDCEACLFRIYNSPACKMELFEDIKDFLKWTWIDAMKEGHNDKEGTD